MPDMEIEFTKPVESARGKFGVGDRATMPDYDAKPLVDCGAAVAAGPVVVAEVDVLLACNVANLDELLAHMNNATVIRQAREWDRRKSAEPKYDARLAELEGA